MPAKGLRSFSSITISEAADETKGIIEREGGECTAFEADVSDSQAVEEMAEGVHRDLWQDRHPSQ